MSTDFSQSKTKENLMRAFAGECQAKMRYALASKKATAAGLYIISSVFDFTAAQEGEHASVFMGHLADSAGESIVISGGYPVDDASSVISLLDNAVHNENEEYTDVYKAFAEDAEKEGFEGIAASFRRIAEIEKTHAERFAHFSELMKKNRLFSSDESTEWICLHCGHIHKGTDAPEMCPVCSGGKGYFIRASLAPYTGR